MNADIAPVTLRAEDAIELREMLEFLHDWLHDQRLAASYQHFTFGVLTVAELRAGATALRSAPQLWPRSGPADGDGLLVR